MAIKDNFFTHGSFVLGNGHDTRFWEDIWLGDMPLAIQYPSLFNIARHKNVLVADVLLHRPLNIEFRRSLTGNRWTSWLNLVERLMRVSLTDSPDVFNWNSNPSGIFSVKSLYANYLNGHTPFLRKYLWKLTVPLK